jgi:hypothetical protein
MVCLYHGDYGPADPTFDLGSASHFGMHGWMVDATLLKNARNIGEAQAIERHLIRGESVLRRRVSVRRPALRDLQDQGPGEDHFGRTDKHDRWPAGAH